MTNYVGKLLFTTPIDNSAFEGVKKLTLFEKTANMSTRYLHLNPTNYDEKVSTVNEIGQNTISADVIYTEPSSHPRLMNCAKCLSYVLLFPFSAAMVVVNVVAFKFFNKVKVNELTDGEFDKLKQNIIKKLMVQIKEDLKDFTDGDLVGIELHTHGPHKDNTINIGGYKNDVIIIGDDGKEQIDYHYIQAELGNIIKKIDFPCFWKVQVLSDHAGKIADGLLEEAGEFKTKTAILEAKRNYRRESTTVDLASPRAARNKIVKFIHGYASGIEYSVKPDKYGFYK